MVLLYGKQVVYYLKTESDYLQGHTYKYISSVVTSSSGYRTQKNKKMNHVNMNYR